MEDDINFYEKGRRPKVFENGRRPQYFLLKEADLKNK